MAFIYNLTDSWNDVATTWNGIKLAVTDTGSSSTSKLLNLTISGSSTGYFYVDKSGNLTLSGSVNKITMTAPATGATLTLADGSSFITSGAYSTTFTTTGTTTLTLPTSGTVTALGNTTTGSGSIVLATSPTLVSPALGTPTALTLTNATGLPISTGLTGTGSGVLTALAVNVGSAGAFVTFNGALGTPSSGNLSNCSGYPSGSLSGLGTGVATALAQNVGNAGAIVVQNGVLGTPSSGTLTNCSGLSLTTGVTGTLPVANGGTGITSFGTGVATALGVNVGSAGAFVVNGGALGTPSSGTLTNATGLPISTGVSGLGTGVATFLATPSSANLASAVTDETGSGPLVFATSPTFTSQITLGTQSTTRGTLVLANTTAGSKAVTLQSSNSTAAAYTLTLPAAAPVNGYYLQTDNLGQLSWAAGGGGGGGSPGGSNTQVQFNDAATFGGAAAFTYDKTTYTLGLGVASTTTGIFNLYNASSANAVSIKSGNNASAWSLTLPTSGGSANYFLQTDGSGNTTWAAAAAGTINTGTVGQITYYSGTNTLSGTTTGTGVLTALGVNTGSAGAFVVNGGALGTPSSGTLTNCTGIPAAGITGTLGVANGGTGLTSLTAGYIPYGNGTSAFNNSANLTYSGTVLTAVGEIYASQAATNTQQIRLSPQSSGSNIIYSTYAGTNSYLPLVFNVGGSDRLTIDTSGNLGLGVTPSAWSAYKALQVASNGGAISSSLSSDLEITTNTYNAGAGWLSQGSGVASSRYRLYAGTHAWYNAPSSTSGAAITFTQAMTLDASGNLGVGTASPSSYGKLAVYGASGGVSSRVISQGGTVSDYAQQILVAGSSLTHNINMLVYGDGSGNYHYSTAPFNFGTSSSNPLIFVTNSTERARFSGTAATLSIGTSAATNPGSIQLYGSTSGSVTISTPAAAGSTTVTLPSTTGTLLSTAETATITKGFTVTPASISTGSFTVTPANGNYQYVTNNGAYTITNPASDCAVDILVTNGASAGATTFTGFTVASGNTGDPLTTTNTNKFIISVRRINGTSTYVIKALQ